MLNVLRKFTVRKQILERFFLTLLVTKKKLTRSESQAINYANDNWQPSRVITASDSQSGGPGTVRMSFVTLLD